MKNHKKKTSIFKNSATYFMLLLIILTIAFNAQMFFRGMIPMKYTIPVLIITIILCIAMWYLQFSSAINRLNHILGKVIIVILCIMLVFGNLLLFRISSAVSKVTNEHSQVDVVSIVVLKDSTATSLKDLEDKQIGRITIGDVAPIEKAIMDIKKTFKSDVLLPSYKTYKEYAYGLYDGGVDAILVNESSRSQLEDVNKTFSTDTRVIHTFQYKKETKDISKNVKVENESFNIYISGIDTYGSISTVSRSDVNMIMTVNPKTHKILLTSIPRDYYVPQPCQNDQTDKITHTGLFGITCTVDTVENYFDIDLNYYARVNFSSVVDIVDALGGVTIDNPHTFVAVSGEYFEAGEILLNGSEALAYSRERKAFADGDRERGRDQMRVITGIISKAISPAIITNYAGILDAIGNSFQTNISDKEMKSLIKKQLNSMKKWDIKQISVSGKGNGSAWSPANGTNAWVMEPDVATVNNAVKLINKVLNGETLTDSDIQYQNELVGYNG